MIFYVPNMEIKYLEGEIRYRTYGIIEISTNTRVRDVSTKLIKVIAIAFKLTVYKASPIHLKEIIENMI